MSNNRNLGNIATAITNATSGQVLTSQGNGVATFADAAGGVSTIGSLDFSPSAINETSTITTSSNMSNAPFISAFKEIPASSGVSTKSNWDVNSTASNYDMLDEAPLSYSGLTVTPSNASADGTFTLSSGSFASGDVGKQVAGNGGVAKITSTSGSYSLVTAFTNTNAIAAGSWSLKGLIADSSAGLKISSSSAPYGFSGISPSQGTNYFDPNELSERGLAFKSDGSRMYVVDASTREIFQYDLTTDWDPTSASLPHDGKISVSSQDGTPTDLAFKPDGSKMYITGDANNAIIEYNITSWDVTTAQHVQSKSLASSSVGGYTETNPAAMVFKPDGTKMYVLGKSNDYIFEFDLTADWDVSTMSYSNHTSIGGNPYYEGNGEAMVITPDGKNIIMSGSGRDGLHHLTMTNAWDISQVTTGSDSSSYHYNFNNDGGIGASTAFCYGLALDNTGQYIFLMRNNAYIYRYNFTGTSQPTSQYLVATTNSSGQIDTTAWNDLNSLTADETLNDGATYYAFSTDGRTTWKVQDSSGNLRSIAKLNSSTWQYNNNATFGSETWVNATNNNQQSALQQALGAQAVNRLTGTSLATYSDANLLSTGNTFDLMIGLYIGSAGTSPTSDAITINYDASTQNKGAILGTDYDVEKLSDTQLKFTALTQKNMHFKVI